MPRVRVIYQVCHEVFDSKPGGEWKSLTGACRKIDDAIEQLRVLRSRYPAAFIARGVEYCLHGEKRIETYTRAMYTIEPVLPRP